MFKLLPIDNNHPTIISMNELSHKCTKKLSFPLTQCQQASHREVSLYLLYLIYTADIPTKENKLLLKFADGSLILATDIVQWTKILKINLNEGVARCVHVLYTLRHEYTTNNCS